MRGAFEAGKVGGAGVSFDFAIHMQQEPIAARQQQQPELIKLKFKNHSALIKIPQRRAFFPE